MRSFQDDICGSPAGRAGEGGAAGAGPVSRFFLRAAFVLAFLSIVFLSLNAFPHGGVEGLYPERPAYILSLLGIFCYAASLHWLPQVRNHSMLLALVGAFLLYGLAVTCVGLVRIDEPGLAPFVLFQYLKRKVIPVLYILWFAFMLSPLPECKARRFFIGALVVMFLPNALHMALEMFANAGFSGMREYLVNINPWFRQENTSHGMWPPPYFTDRVRGLFAEPSHLAYALTPLLAFFFYKLRSRAAYIPPVLFVGFAFAGTIPTLTGIIGFAFLLFVFLFDMICARLGTRRALYASTCVLVAAVIALTATFWRKGDVAELAVELHTVETIAGYCRAAQDDSAAEPPHLSVPEFSRFFTRLACLRIETDIALRHPWGTGFYLSGLYWKPLLVWSSEPVELFIWVRDAFKNPVPVIPHLCEYTALAAELGFPGLLLFLLICGFIAVRAGKRYARDKDAFVLYMVWALCASLLTLLAFALKSGFMLYYFLGFLYAIGGVDYPASAETGVVRRDDGNASARQEKNAHA